MSNVLYEASFTFEPAFLIPIIMLVFTALFPTIIKKYYESRGNENNNQISETGHMVVKYFCISAAIFLILISLIIAIFQIKMYNKTIGAYNRGEYKIVEGFVENFDPMPYGGHSEESFEIDGVYFSYSDYNIIQGYNNAKSHGGVITGDGQHLKIGYVYYNETYGNIIVYIEELP